MEGGRLRAEGFGRKPVVAQAGEGGGEEGDLC